MKRFVARLVWYGWEVVGMYFLIWFLACALNQFNDMLQLAVLATIPFITLGAAVGLLFGALWLRDWADKHRH